MKKNLFKSLLKSKKFNIFCFVLGNLGYAIGGFFSAYQQAKDDFALTLQPSLLLDLQQKGLWE